MKQNIQMLLAGMLLVVLITGTVLYASLDQATATHDRAHDDAGQVLASLVEIRHAAMRIVASTAEFGLLAGAAAADDDESPEHTEQAETDRSEAAEDSAASQRQRELMLIGEGQLLFKQQLDRYRTLVTRLYPGDRPGAERLFYEGNLLRQTAAHLLEALNGVDKPYDTIELKEQFEASEDRFLELAEKLIVAERHRAEQMAHTVDRSLSAAQYTLFVGVLLLLLLLGQLYRLIREQSR